MGKKTKQDPTGQNSNRNKGSRILQARIKKAKAEVMDLFSAIPKRSTVQKRIINARDDQVVYEYDISPTEQQLLAAGVTAAVNGYLLESQDAMPADWYWKKKIELPYRQGTLEESARFNQLIAESTIAAKKAGDVAEPFIAQITSEQVLTSREYRDALQNVYASNYHEIKALSEKTASQVIQVVNDGISAGETPARISKQISERFGVAESSAQRIATTEFNRAYTNSKLNAVKVISKRTGLRAGVIHISALMPSTRSSHAARHGNAYTVADQEQWWNSGANRINCHCNVISVLIDNNGRVVQSQTQEEIKAERDYFTKG